MNDLLHRWITRPGASLMPDRVTRLMWHLLGGPAERRMTTPYASPRSLLVIPPPRGLHEQLGAERIHDPAHHGCGEGSCQIFIRPPTCVGDRIEKIEIARETRCHCNQRCRIE